MGRADDGTIYVQDAQAFQHEPASRNARMRQIAEQDGREVLHKLPQDPGQAGVDQARAMTLLFSGFAVETARVTGAKTLRADPYASQVNAGNVVLVRGHWNGTYIEELRTFPNGTYDDLVDASSDAFTSLYSGSSIITL
jgi:predicted phage terminase large subunit-like protein